jgi:transposase
MSDITQLLEEAVNLRPRFGNPLWATCDFNTYIGGPSPFTGGRSILGRISKRGSKYVRTLFIQAANVILMRPHSWERFSFGAWLLSAAPRLHRHKLATALANKLARISWSILRNEKVFDTPLTR